MAEQMEHNGYEFIATYRPQVLEGILPGRVILGQLKTGNSPTGAQFVTAYLPDDDICWQFGHYFNNQNEATIDYGERITRGL